jgi:hypothetical protein
MRNKELRRDCEARNLSREERKMMVIMRQIEEMEHKEKVKAGRVPHGNASTSLGKGSSGGSLSSSSCQAITGQQSALCSFFGGQKVHHKADFAQTCHHCAGSKTTRSTRMHVSRIKAQERLNYTGQGAN